ncbi:transposase [Streptomyces gottesmaniae]|uniref:transposase n=1 Tax=Streptomyces gottesmaniae TaxID=3075518 RepID=UPI0034D97DBF
MLAEVGDDRARFTHSGNLQASAGSAPVTRQSGKSRHVAHRRIKNNRLAATGRYWALAALTGSPGAHDHYNRRGDTGDHHRSSTKRSP